MKKLKFNVSLQGGSFLTIDKFAAYGPAHIGRNALQPLSSQSIIPGNGYSHQSAMYKFKLH